MEKLWTIGTTLAWTEGYLEDKGDRCPRISAQWLMSAATGLSRIELYTHYEQPLSGEERDVLRGSIKRRAEGEPLQYITGEVGFRHVSLTVRPGVLIPRPETEVLVSEVIHHFKENAAPKSRIVDLCTGSGCIACSLAHELENVSVYATDISDEALLLAGENIAKLGLQDRVETFAGDLGEAVPDEAFGMLDAVCANPPYIPTALLHDLSREVVAFEPLEALNGGDDGLDLFRRIVPWAYEALKPGGLLAVELHETCLDAAAAFVVEHGFEQARIVEDLANKPRIICATKPM